MENNKKIYIFLGLLLVVGLIPLIKAKPPIPPEEVVGEVVSTQFERIK